MNPAASSMVNSEQLQPKNEVQQEEEEEEDFDNWSTEEIEADHEDDDDDSDEDPTFDIHEETCRSLSKLSLKKSKSRIPKVIDNQGEVEEDVETIKVQPMELDDDDDESDLKGGFDKVEKLIQAGQLEKLKVEECKLYLRKHGLRLTGNKDVLIQRIREHLQIINGGGEHKYPVSSFVLNCKGDACTGDIVMFEQNVYEMFSIASRSATGPPCGTRVIAGRIVKESYGAAKQQHTFTIEVLWSKGVKPLPPLHPLLIKGRNLYRLQTMRQRWDDEEKRRQVLLEKHSRGASARSNRETRIQVKEMRKTLRGQRVTGTAQEQRRQPRSDTLKNSIQSQTQQPFVAPVRLNQWATQFTQQKPAAPPNTVPVVTEICQQKVSRLQPTLIKPQNCNVIEQKTRVSENSNGVEHGNSGFTAVENHQRNGFHPVAKMQHCYPSKDHRSHDGLQGGNHGASNGSLHKQPSILGSPPRSPMRHLSRNDHGFNVQRCSNENGKFPQRQPLTTLRSPPRNPLHRSPVRHLSRNDHGFNVQKCSNENGKFPQRQPLTTSRSPPRSPLHRSPVHHLSRNDHGFNVQKCSNENGKFPQRQPLTTSRSPPRSPLHRSPVHHLSRNDHGFNVQKYSNENGKFPQRQPLTTSRSPPRSPLHRSPMHHLSRNDHGFNLQKYSNENDKFPQRQPMSTLNSPPRSPLRRWGRPMERQLCRHYLLGRCHYGDNCKFAHENGDRREHRLPNNQRYYGYH